MNKNKTTDDLSVLIIGEDKLAYSVAANMLKNGWHTTLLAQNSLAAYAAVEYAEPKQAAELVLWNDWPEAIPQKLVIAITAENSNAKANLITTLENRLAEDALLAINIEGISLEELQGYSTCPERILGLNWCYPAHLTFFLEIISNAQTNVHHVDFLTETAKKYWDKDPYTVSSGFSIRAQMMAAWVREALYLVQNGYASVESIDRTCRNDAGYYLPFAGNFRYMDLMGTYAYGMVMKDLNPELAKTNEYQPNSFAGLQPEFSEEIFLQFSEEIRALILKYNHETFDS